MNEQRCTARVRLTIDGGHTDEQRYTAFCRLAGGHPGAHQDGIFTWVPDGQEAPGDMVMLAHIPESYPPDAQLHPGGSL